MRVTNNMMTMNMLLNVNKNLETMSEKQNQLATGKRISLPSDDPVLASKVLTRKTDLAELEQYEKNTSDALGWMEITEKALESNGDIFQRIRELTVQAANGTNTSEDTQKIKLEVENMKDQLIANGNTTFAGRYIFSGFETNEKLFNKDGSFNIDIDQYALDNKPVVKYEISVGQSIDVMTSGLDVYGTVADENIMTDTFPSGNADGIISSKESLYGSFDLTEDYTADTLDVTLNGLTYDIDESILDGTLVAMDKNEVLDAYKNAVNGVNTLSEVADIYFDASDNLVIESKLYGPGIPIISQGSAIFTTASEVGVEAVEATVNNGSNTFIDPLSATDIEDLKNTNINVIVNGVSRKVKPSYTAVITDVASYLAEININLDAAFDSDIVDVTAPAGVLTFTSKNTDDSIKPNIRVDFPKSHESQMIADIDELMSYLETGDSENISSMLATIDKHMNNMLSLRADVGARTNRMELMSKKIASDNVSFTKLLSDAEDADVTEVIMQLKNAENVYNASLAVGAKVIQPSLMDFLQ